jgi:hypothetical protein
MPEDRRKHWEKGLLHGFGGISKGCLGHVHNIPTHHAMGLYCAGVCFNREDWKKQAREFMAKVVATQSPGGWWSEHSGPVVGYNFVYSDALGVYYAMSHDTSVLEALRRAAVFHANFTYPDGARVETVDERNPYHTGVALGNVGFSFTPEGRGYLLHQNKLNNWKVDADFAASLLLYGETGKAAPIPADLDESLNVVGNSEALVFHKKPWFVCISAFVCEPSTSRWIQDRQNFVSIYHDSVGLIVGGGNTKLQPFWSNFTVGDTALLKHTPGDENPDFKPKGDLVYLPSTAKLQPEKDSPRIELKYGDEDCAITIRPENEKRLIILYEAMARHAPPVEGHITLMPYLNGIVKCASGKSIKLASEGFEWQAAEMGDWVEYHNCRLSIPPGARLVWPKKSHNPYKKDGSSTLDEARMVLCLPFDKLRALSMVERPFSKTLSKYEILLEITK